MKKKVLARLLSFLLSGMLVVSSIQMPVYAEEVSRDQEADTGKMSEEGNEEEEFEENDLKDTSLEQEAGGDTPGETGGDTSGKSTDSDEVAEETVVETAETPVLGNGMDSAETEETEKVLDSEETPETGSEVVTLDDPGITVTPTYSIKNFNKNTYLTGSRIDLTGVQLEIIGQTTNVVAVTEEMLGDYDRNSEGVKNVSVSYLGNVVTSINVLYVNAPSGTLSMNYGQELSEIQLSSNGDGEWEWENSLQTANKVGKQTFKAKFIPNQGKYRDLTGIDVTVNVRCSLTEYATMTVSEPSADYTYDGTEKKPGVTVTVGGTTLRSGLDYELTYGDNINAGTASVKIVGKGDYENEKTEYFSIAKAKLSIKAKDITIYCGENNPFPSSDPKYYEISGLANESDLKTKPTLICEVADTTTTASYRIIPDGAEIADTAVDNYEGKIEYTTGTLNIKEFKPQSVKLVNVITADKEYDKSPWTFSGSREIRDAATNNVVHNVTAQPSYSGRLWDGSLYPDSGADSTMDAPTEAGRYTLTFTLGGKDAALYELEETSASYDFRITPKVVTITANSVTVKPGELVPDIKELQGKYEISGLLSGDTQDSVLDTKNVELRYSEEDISADKAGDFEIIPSGAEVINRNYTVAYVSGTLKVEGKLKFTADFTSINAEDMTYSSQKHSISGYATGMGTYQIVVTGETRETEIGTDGETQYIKYKEEVKEVSPANIVAKYQDIAPVEVGDYTLQIFSEIDQRLYDYDGKPLVNINYKILPLQKSETKLVGVEGIPNRIYDGKATNLSEQIRNARVRTNENIDITDKVTLEVWIKADSTGESGNYTENNYQDTKFDKDAPDVSKMPTEAGKYRLQVKIVEDLAENYVANEWNIPFTIQKRPLTVTVENMKIPINAQLPASSEYKYIITDGSIEDEENNILDNGDFARPVIEPFGEVDTTKAGSYDLIASGNIAGDKENNYEVTFVNGKLFIQAKLWSVKELNLTNNKNIPHGKTLEEIAENYLPGSVTIYLDENGTIEDTAAIEWKTDRPVSGSYNIGTQSSQNFKMQGTVVLPDLVYAEKELTVTVDVSVREADDGTRALKPYADIAGGTVGAGTMVSLFTSEEGADIYYTVEADNPSLSVSSKRYDGPIEIKCTMTIRAVSRIYGKLDSEELRVTYYYNKNLTPGGSDDPSSGPQVPDEDIPKDENGRPLEIPKGLWVTDVAQYTYTGSAIKPVVRVYDYKTRLEEKKDYTISYKYNVNAADKNNPTKAPTIVIKGKGNYQGTINKTFTIAPKNISDVHKENGRDVYDVKADDITVAYNGKAQRPAIAVTWNGKKLTNKKDYTYESVAFSEVNTYPITLVGNGNYTGERRIVFVISNATPASKFTVSKIANYIYTGTEIKPAVSVTYNKVTMRQGIDYTLSYEDNVEIGTASVVIRGMGKFAGVKRVNFKITTAAVLNKGQVALEFASGTVYTGKEITPSAIKLAVTVKNNGATETRVLTADDYKVTYQNNVKVGTATAIFEGVGAYSGTLKKTFKITPYNIQNIPADQIIAQTTCSYMKGGAALKPVVLFDGKALQEGTDYKLSYRNNAAVGNTAVMTIKGKGNFKGSVLRTFQVTTRNISNVTVSPADKIYKAKANNYKTTVRVLDTNGKALTAGKDYDRNIAYTYAERVTLPSGVVKNQGDPVTAQDIIPAGTKINVTVTAIGSNYQGTATGTYSIVQANVSSAKVTVPAMTYTGKAIEPKQSEITVTINKIPLSASDYTIVGYSNNINQGTAKLTIQGKGNYGGTKTVSFKIKKKSLFAQLFG